MDYCAIDFETASKWPESACSIGLVRMDGGGKVLDRFYSLICPKEPSFDPFCTAVHHLEPADILSAPTIAEIADDIKAFIGSTPLVAHNAQFDIKVMNASLASWGIESVRNPYFCTLSLARKVMRGEPSYRLTALAAHFGWEYDAHNALADSEICGRLFRRLCGDALLNEEDMKAFFRRIYREKKGRYPRIPQALSINPACTAING